MISAKELMIGDLVNYRPGWINEETNQVEYECGTGFPVRIEMLYYSHGEGLVQYNDGENDGIEAAEYELFPIPITSEILIKNGFEIERTNDNILVYRKDGEVVYYEFGKNYGITIDNSLAQIQELKVRYVHQLQQAMRLCGIEKEIKL